MESGASRRDTPHALARHASPDAISAAFDTDETVEGVGPQNDAGGSREREVPGVSGGVACFFALWVREPRFSLDGPKNSPVLSCLVYPD